METPNTASLAGELSRQGMSEPELARTFATFNAGAPAFKREGARHGVDGGNGDHG
jgi:hypothetical protein